MQLQSPLSEVSSPILIEPINHAFIAKRPFWASDSLICKVSYQHMKRQQQACGGTRDWYSGTAGMTMNSSGVHLISAKGARTSS